MTDKHLFFDLDRTLWDFDTNSKETLQELFLELKINEHIDHFDRFYHQYVETNASLWKLYGSGKMTKDMLRDERFRSTLKIFQLTDEDLVKQLSDAYVERSPKKTALFPFAQDTLDQLQKDGYHMHIITNGFQEVQFTKLENCGLIHFFKEIVCSEEIGINKPNPEIFHHCMKKAGVTAKNSVMIGDDLQVDIMGAHNAGMHAVHFDPSSNKPATDVHQISCLSELPAKLTWVLR